MTKKLLRLFALFILACLLLSTVLSCGTTPDASEKEQDGQDSQNKGEDNISGNISDNISSEEFEALSEVEKAFYILESEATMAKSKLTTEMHLECYYYGSLITVDILQEYTVIQTEDTYEEHNEMTIVSSTRGAENIIVMSQGYRDGKKYSRMETNGIVDEKEVVKMTTEEYLLELEEGLEEIPENFGISRNTCNSVSCSQESNKDWIAEFSELEDLSYFQLLVYEYFGDVLVNDISDVTVTLTTDQGLLPKSLEIEYEFYGTKKPSFVIYGEYSFDDEITLPPIDWSDYSDTTVISPPNMNV